MIPSIEDFSAGYALITDVDVVSHGGDRAILDNELHQELCHAFGRPVAKLNGAHYELASSGTIPTNTAAVPEFVHSDMTDAAKDRLLIAKRGMPLQ